MAVPSSLVGTSAVSEPVQVDARWTMAFAAGVGDTSPAYFDTTLPGGVVAHPLFVVCPEWPAVRALRAASAHLESPEDAARRVHWTHDVHVRRLVVPGDVLTVTAEVVAVFRHRAGAAQVARFDTVDADGAPVATTWLGTISLGSDVDGDDVVGDVPPPPAAVDDDTPPAAAEELAVAAGAAHVYSECSRIWNPIHTDAAVARAAGLPGIILHGTATLAMAVSALLDVHGAAPAAVRRVTAHMRAMVPMPTTLSAEIGEIGDDGTTPFSVLLPDGRPAVNRSAVVLDTAATATADTPEDRRVGDELDPV